MRHLLDGQGAAGWVTELTQLKEAVISARTDLPYSSESTQVFIANFGDEIARIEAGTSLGVARKVAINGRSGATTTAASATTSTTALAAAAETGLQITGEVSSEQTEEHAPYMRHLDKIIAGLSSELTSEERRHVVELQSELSESFSKGEFDIGYTDLLSHTIDTENNRPVKEPLQ